MSGHPFLLADAVGKVFNFSLVSMVVTVGLFCMTLIMLRDNLSVPTLLIQFVMNEC